mmetsp:Transcript_11107/g.25260  ORF Transcript_11107/g.25260 Transcript_11107/m.25260 type:complete len:200 (-) Transcript_11107:527-1126(-)
MWHGPPADDAERGRGRRNRGQQGRPRQHGCRGLQRPIAGVRERCLQVLQPPHGTYPSGHHGTTCTPARPGFGQGGVFLRQPQRLEVPEPCGGPRQGLCWLSDQRRASMRICCWGQSLGGQHPLGCLCGIHCSGLQRPRSQARRPHCLGGGGSATCCTDLPAGPSGGRSSLEGFAHGPHPWWERRHRELRPAARQGLGGG